MARSICHVLGPGSNARDVALHVRASPSLLTHTGRCVLENLCRDLHRANLAATVAGPFRQHAESLRGSFAHWHFGVSHLADIARPIRPFGIGAIAPGGWVCDSLTYNPCILRFLRLLLFQKKSTVMTKTLLSELPGANKPRTEGNEGNDVCEPRLKRRLDNGWPLSSQGADH